MAWSCVTIRGEEITIQADPAIDLAGGRLRDLFLCRAQTVTANYVRTDGDAETVLVNARTAERAMDEVAYAIMSGVMVRRRNAMSGVPSQSA